MSMFAVASSNKTIFVFLKIARQMLINCFSPVDRFYPPSFISRSSPALLSLFRRSPSFAFSNSVVSSSSGFSLNGSRLNLSVPLNNTASWGITVT